jgi:hypothetical protein
MKKSLRLAAISLALAVNLSAQQAKKGIDAEGGGVDERASARVLYWNEATNSAAGEFAINYGRPVWKADYENPAKFDGMTKGKVWRMGSNFWTDLETQLPLTIGGKKIPVGHYYVGLSRSKDGSNWSLAFIDPAKVRSAHLDGFEINKAQVQFKAPVSVAKAGSKVDKLTITMAYPKDDIKNVTLKIDWGNLSLTTPINVALPQ